MTTTDQLAAALREKLPEALSDYGIHLARDPINFEGKASGIAPGVCGYGCGQVDGQRPRGMSDEDF